ncbi:MAG: HD-GYP domain-containing protein [Gaiellaceae bacterium]
MRFLRPTMLVLAIGLAPVSLVLAVLSGRNGSNAVDILAAVLMATAVVTVSLALGFRLVRASRAAATDPLTGLGNQERLLSELRRLLPRATEAQPLLLGLFDLEGFQEYNDSFGHFAGDALLARLGRNLAEALGGRGGAYRSGGDEFVVLVPVGDEGRALIMAEAKAALSERGEGFAVGSVDASVLLPQETDEVELALRLVDQRLFAAKAASSLSASRQSADVLLRALQERSPELGDHLLGVARLAVEVGKRLGMSGGELDQLAQAAQLHDVGKMAIPDTILRKPGPLDQEEWEFIRGHTLVGERITSAAPSLLDVARIIRSSHERYNGSGYPDGLRGEQIPLASRVVAVADAFDAMIGPRPYRLGMSDVDALEELQRCSGAQFDPVVVDLFCSVLAEQAETDRPVGALS